VKIGNSSFVWEHIGRGALAGWGAGRRRRGILVILVLLLGINWEWFFCGNVQIRSSSFVGEQIRNSPSVEAYNGNSAFLEVKNWE
jgi:hypothetical protein